MAGRIGRLHTPHGTLETPYLFPVIDPTRQTPDISFISEIGFNGIITNAYLYFRRNKGTRRPIHEYLNWSHVVMTDSGGYQILEYGDISVDNRTIVSFEKQIGVDIGVILDLPTGGGVSYEEARARVYETYRRAIEALPLIMDSRQLWALPVQGAPYMDLFIRSSLLSARLPYHIYALGSPTVLLEKYDYAPIVEMTLIARRILLPSSPIHVFGVGHPMIIPFLVAAGADLFDSASYTLYARDDRYMTESGTKRLSDLEYLPCSCPVCSKYGEARYLLELSKNERAEAIAKHNLYMLSRELRLVKQAIKEGRLWELLEYRSKAHPSLRGAFNVLVKHGGLLSRYSPVTSPEGRAVLISGSDSEANPRVRYAKKRVFKYLAGKTNRGYRKIVLIPAHKKPYTEQGEYRAILNKCGDDVLILFIHPYLGLIPPELASTYPYYQHEAKFAERDVSPDGIVREIIRVARALSAEVVVVDEAWVDSPRIKSTLEKIKSNIRVAVSALGSICT